ncbi:hypothetical protein BCR42DRAFT_429894 [Absidia repens]|uniref:START domain-containing protein n=1 Tax=Absidia repens TaxID=90262 RepID=A0A1X2HL05_9FUNG|nr:hypothetical protein BCR42DRAFT_429894 [Absidia repens]
MIRGTKRQETSFLSSNTSPNIISRLGQDRDSGYTEADSDLDSHQLPQLTRGAYPFSDDEEPITKQPSTWSTTLSKTFQTSTSNSLSSTIHPPSILTTSLVHSSSYHIHQADTAIDSVRQYTHETDWKKVLKHKSGVIVYMLEKHVNGDKLAVFKGESVISGFTPQSVFYVIGMRKLWTTSKFDDGKLVQNLNETTSVIYEAYRSNGSSRAYDLTLVEKIDCSNDGVIIFACTSIDTNQVAKVSGRTRNQVKSLARKPLVIASIDKYLKSKVQVSHIGTQQQSKKPVNKLLSPLSEYTRRRPSIMTSQASTTPLSSNYKPILKNPPPRHSSLKAPQTTSRSPSLTKRITFADDIIIPPLITENTEAPIITIENSEHQLDQQSPATLDNTSSDTASSKLYPEARHRSSRKESVTSYKRLLSSDITEWKKTGECEGVKTYAKASHCGGLPILRGDGWLEGSWTAEQVCSVVQCFGARSKWDDYFKHGKIIERFSQKEYLVYTQMKSIFPINGRDFSLLTHIDSDARSETIHVVSTSVSDKLTPATDDYVRGRMLIYGWTFQALKDETGKRTGVNITFISHMDLVGMTPSPSAAIQLLTAQIPLYVLRVQQYITTKGCPPYIRRVAGKILSEVYDHDNHQYKLTYIAKHFPSKRHHHPQQQQQLHTEDSWCTDIRIHASIYKKSFKITTQPQQDILVVVRPDKTGARIYTKNDALDNTIIKIDLSPSPLDTTIESLSPPLIEGSSPEETQQKHLASATNDTIDPGTNISENQALLTTTAQTHPLVPLNNKKSTKHTYAETNRYHKQGNWDCTKEMDVQQQNHSIIIINDHLSFNGPQLALILILVVISYYIGKLSCRC